MQERSCYRRIAENVNCYAIFRAMAKKKDPAAVRLGRRGGLKGGRARWANVSAEERSRILREAARARWAKKRPGRVTG